ncbi:MAG: hypothetical protein OEV44_13655 [Spirochaetota bacterium]|nr:hypothetical protein [Spirochaetota bacterium]
MNEKRKNCTQVLMAKKTHLIVKNYSEKKGLFLTKAIEEIIDEWKNLKEKGGK